MQTTGGYSDITHAKSWW